MSTGFEVINQTLWITKDPEAQLVYTLDWTDWLAAGDSIAEAEFEVVARANDPDPLLKVSDGINAGNQTYVELAAGQLGKSYTVSIKITTADGLIDRRSFKVKIEQRSV